MTHRLMMSVIVLVAETSASPIGAVFFDGEIQFSCAPEHGRERTMVILKQLEDLPQKAISGSIIQNSLACVFVLEFSALNVGPNV